MKNPLVITLLALSILLGGCASPSANPDPVIQEKMTPLIGKTSQEVVAVLGEPTRKSVRVMPEGQQDLYIYSYAVLLDKFSGFWTGFKYGFSGGRDRTITVTLANDKVIGIEGF